MAGRIATIVKGYPRLSETFIAQEIAGLEDRGVAQLIVSLRQPAEKRVHPVHRRIIAEILYLPEYLKDDPARVRAGRAFAERARAFGAHVTVYDPFMPEDAPLPNGVRRQNDLQQALAAADIVSLHMPRTPETAMLFNTDKLRQMKPGAILVNTARGGIVDETALPAAFAEGRPAIYATDVLEQEPPRADDPLLASDQLIVTPHSAAMTQEGARRMATRSCQNVLDYFADALDPDMVAG